MVRLADVAFAVLFVGVVVRAAVTDLLVPASTLAGIALVVAVVGFSLFDPDGGDHAASLVVHVALVGATALALVLVLTDLTLVSRAVDLALFYLVVLALVGYRRAPLSSTISLFPYLGAFAVVVGLFLLHSLDVSPGSGLAAFPVFATLLLGVCLFVVPRYVEADFLLRFVGALSAVIVLVGLPSLFVGSYSLPFFSVSPWSNATLSPWFVGELPVLRSIFPNPNTLGLLVFPAVLGGVVDLHRTYGRSGSVSLFMVVPGVFLAINAVGLYLTNSRASYLAAAVGLALYAAVVVIDRRAVPVLFAGLAVAAPLVGFGVFRGVVPIDPSNRFALWGASVEALLAGPTLLGAGVVNTSELIAPFLSEGLSGQSSHSSYLSIALRIGLVGGVAYCLLVIGPLIHGAWRFKRVDVGMFALAAGFAVHQLFEGYTLFQYGPGSILAALVVGYVIASVVPEAT
ncbi:O-antigen ligase family protein [Halalkalicoccus subterraneus]|uniref:O-antigen ligase family protein n=1 Tax=Halalkalicoccus subterraneus TaxID=2675002 RepID=UPI000EFD779B|nr:O-antigen ligase family protein [Halalkalicoccus subterraneus]